MTKKKTTKKTTKKKTDLKKDNIPEKIKFAHKRNPEFEQTLQDEALRSQAKIAALEEQKQKEIDEYLKPENSRGSESAPDISTIPFNATQAISPILKIPFSIVANIKECPAVRLTDNEAEEWAIPIVGLLEYYFPGKIPEIAWIWLCFATSTAKVIDSRVEILHQHNKNSAAPQAVQEQTGGRIPLNAPHHFGAEPKDTFPQAS